MINRDDIEAGDKVYTRQGDILVVTCDNGILRTIRGNITDWKTNGEYGKTYFYPWDIIRIEKAPKPVVVEAFVGVNHDGGCVASSTFNAVRGCAKVLKIILVNGVWDKEKSEQVK